jgi:ABC-type nickel/cobalt efflux system permease component RcnA
VHDPALNVLGATAATIAFFHTLFGPDHYLPFIAMARVGRWSLIRTLAITVACGTAHILGSAILGALGILLGLAVGSLQWLESIRGEVAAWLLLGFGLAYMVWGVRHARRKRPHTHWHGHADGSAHTHEHVHVGEHSQAHTRVFAPDVAEPGKRLTPWVLFTVFVFGPCEPLIPLLMYPAAEGSWYSVVVVTLIFSVCTLGTMVAAVVAGYLGLSGLSLGRLRQYSHAAAGLTLFACGVAIRLSL